MRASLLDDEALSAVRLLALAGFDTALESSLAFVRGFVFGVASCCALVFLDRVPSVFLSSEPVEFFGFAFDD